MMKLALFGIAAVFAAAVPDCGSVAPHDAAPRPTDVCAAACDALYAARCHEGDTTDGGLTCVVLCRQIEGSGYLTMSPQCIVDHPTRVGIQHCGVRCQ